MHHLFFFLVYVYVFPLGAKQLSSIVIYGCGFSYHKDLERVHDIVTVFGLGGWLGGRCFSCWERSDTDGWSTTGTGNTLPRKRLQLPPGAISGITRRKGLSTIETREVGSLDIMRGKEKQIVHFILLHLSSYPPSPWTGHARYTNWKIHGEKGWASMFLTNF